MGNAHEATWDSSSHHLVKLTNWTDQLLIMAGTMGQRDTRDRVTVSQGHSVTQITHHRKSGNFIHSTPEQSSNVFWEEERGFTNKYETLSVTGGE